MYIIITKNSCDHMDCHTRLMVCLEATRTPVGKNSSKFLNCKMIALNCRLMLCFDTQGYQWLHLRSHQLPVAAFLGLITSERLMVPCTILLGTAATSLLGTVTSTPSPSQVSLNWVPSLEKKDKQFPFVRQDGPLHKCGLGWGFFVCLGVCLLFVLGFFGLVLESGITFWTSVILW